jgi:glucokinase
MVKSTPLFPRLLGDVGGTNARFAWQERPDTELRCVASLRCIDYPDLTSAVTAYFETNRIPHIKAACIGIATAVTSDQVCMTNLDWSFSIREMQQRLALDKLIIINDFTALALALLDLRDDQKKAVGPAVHGMPDQPIALIGAGTGLGVSGLLPAGEKGWIPISGEGGHITLAAGNAEEFEVIDYLRNRHGHVSAERILSGQGLLELHEALALVRGKAWDANLSASEISNLALDQGDANCLSTMDMFAGLLGSVAGDLALTLGARGGVYIGGGIVPRWLGWFEKSSFRTRFEQKGRFSRYLGAIPTWVISAEDSPALWGAARALDQR